MNVRPFRGYRYDLARVGDLSSVVAPPYDQIPPPVQDRLYALSPWNVVRATLNRDGHAAARATLEEWLRDGVFTREAQPAIYPYHQSYTAEDRSLTRRGVIALGELTEYAKKIVLPHERTHAGPKEERLRLLEATGADMGLLFMVVSDPGGALLQATEPEGGPVGEARDLRGELHRLWRITDQARIERVQSLLAERSVIIADGHHRYETAVEYRRRRPDAGWKMMAFFTLEAPGLTILPTHRLVHGVAGFSLAQFLARAAEWFEVRPRPARIEPTPGVILVVAGEQLEGAALVPRPGSAARIAWPPSTSPAWRGLAVSVLHEGLLKPLLSITDEQLEQKTHVEYTADHNEALALVRKGAYQAAFIIPATTPAELQAVVAGGEVLPQKSTYFYPKLLDGLVFHRIGEA